MTTKPSTRVKDVEEKVDQVVDKAAEEVKEVVDKTADAVGAAVKKASKTAEKAAQSAEDAAEKVTKKGKEALSELENSVFGQFLEHQKKSVAETNKALQALIPQGVKDHSASAYKEAMEGYRTLFNGLIDEIVDSLEKVKIEPKEEKAAKPKATKKKSV
jgi:hypothetical protein